MSNRQQRRKKATVGVLFVIFVVVLVHVLHSSIESSQSSPSMPHSQNSQISVAKKGNLARELDSKRLSQDIVGGTIVSPNAYPFVVRLQFSDDKSLACGGQIIDAVNVLTAAHCCANKIPRDIQVVAGEHNASVTSGLEQIRNVADKGVIIHPDYSSVAWPVDYDVCILRLASPLIFNSVIGPVKLPSQGAAPLAAGTPVTTLGWGYTSEGGVESPVLRSVDLEVLSDSECLPLYRFAPGNYPRHLCAEAANLELGKDACQGDSGGPLVLKSDGETLVGVVSWGDGCGAGFPGVYAEVSYFVDWIANATKLFLDQINWCDYKKQKVVHGLELPGIVYESLTAIDLADCQFKCFWDYSCDCYSYVYSQKLCLKKESCDPNVDQTVVSGMC